MIQDIGRGRFRNEYTLRQEVRPEDRAVVFKGRSILVIPEDEGDGIRLPRCGELSGEGSYQYLFRIDGAAYQMLLPVSYTGDAVPGEGGEPEDAPGISCPGGEYAEIRALRGRHPKEEIYAAETAWQLYCWYRDNRYCGRCGGKMRIGDKERNLICGRCGNIAYPRIMPAVIVGVVDSERDRIMMTRYRGRGFTHHALIAGFCEIGETGEDTVRREVMEETGLTVKNITYYNSQPWGFDSDLLLGYFCELDGEDTVTLDEEELSTAEWVTRSEITETFEDVSLTNDMMIAFKEGRDPFRVRDGRNGIA